MVEAQCWPQHTRAYRKHLIHYDLNVSGVTISSKRNTLLFFTKSEMLVSNYSANLTSSCGQGIVKICHPITNVSMLHHLCTSLGLIRVTEHSKRKHVQPHCLVPGSLRIQSKRFQPLTAKHADVQTQTPPIQFTSSVCPLV